MNGENTCLGRDLHFMSFISVIDLNCSELINIFCGTNKSNTNGNGALSWSPSEVAIFVYLRICVNYLYLCISNFVICLLAGANSQVSAQILKSRLRIICLTWSRDWYQHQSWVIPALWLKPLCVWNKKRSTFGQCHEFDVISGDLTWYLRVSLFVRQIWIGDDCGLWHGGALFEAD